MRKAFWMPLSLVPQSVRTPLILRAKEGEKNQSQGHFLQTGSFTPKGLAFLPVNWGNSKKVAEQTSLWLLVCRARRASEQGRRYAGLGSVHQGLSPRAREKQPHAPAVRPLPDMSHYKVRRGKSFYEHTASEARTKETTVHLEVYSSPPSARGPAMGELSARRPRPPGAGGQPRVGGTRPS